MGAGKSAARVIEAAPIASRQADMSETRQEDFVMDEILCLCGEDVKDAAIKTDPIFRNGHRLTIGWSDDVLFDCHHRSGSESVRRGTDILAMLAALCAKWMGLVCFYPR